MNKRLSAEGFESGGNAVSNTWPMKERRARDRGKSPFSTGHYGSTRNGHFRGMETRLDHVGADSDPRSAQVRLYRPYYSICKRTLDISLSTIMVVLSLPVLLICALIIWLQDRGPILIVQSRTGKGGKLFPMYKFRTMVPNAEELKQKYMHLNELTLPDFKITNDPRVTWVGCILRKTSLDELPQLFNVLKGDMSLVGPRPTSFAATTYDLWQTERLEVLPGITGIWQVSGRSGVDFDKRSRMDIQYIEQQSFWLDIKILYKTISAVLSRRGAC